MDIFNNWVGERETGSWSWEEDLLKAVSGAPCLHHQPLAEEKDSDMLNTPDMLTEEFVAPTEVEGRASISTITDLICPPLVAEATTT